ncbi:hypothetical protein [Streptomyces sp. NPDC059247]|uniref:hypothetical protein n=1 Tax=Streptomyces sp. NPDC059247 TaxID=3346790 RepID=UPI0036CAAF03
MTEPTRHTTYNGPVVRQDGDGNIGINYGSVGAAQGDQELRAAARELIERLRAVEDLLTPDQARVVQEALPVLAQGRPATAEARGDALARLGLLASVIGPLAQPVADAVGKLIQLLS